MTKILKFPRDVMHIIIPWLPLDHFRIHFKSATKVQIEFIESHFNPFSPRPIHGDKYSNIRTIYSSPLRSFDPRFQQKNSWRDKGEYSFEAYAGKNYTMGLVARVRKGCQRKEG